MFLFLFNIFYGRTVCIFLIITIIQFHYNILAVKYIQDKKKRIVNTLKTITNEFIVPCIIFLQ